MLSLLFREKEVHAEGRRTKNDSAYRDRLPNFPGEKDANCKKAEKRRKGERV